MKHGDFPWLCEFTEGDVCVLPPESPPKPAMESWNASVADVHRVARSAPESVRPTEHGQNGIAPTTVGDIAFIYIYTYEFIL